MSNTPRLTLRQIEIVRAVMISGTLLGAARQLNVSQPGISRAMKHIEDLIGMALFERRSGRFVPAPAARDVFIQIQEISHRLSELGGVIDRMRTGAGTALRLGSVLSVASGPLPIALGRMRQRLPDLHIHIDTLNFEETRDYLLLGRGELAFVSGRFDDPLIHFDTLTEGALYCLLPQEHPLAAQKDVGIRQIMDWPLVGLPLDERIIDTTADLRACDLVIETRIGSVVTALVRNRIGIAVVNPHSLYGMDMQGLVVLRIREATQFPLYVARRDDSPLSEFAQRIVSEVRLALAAGGVRPTD